MSKYGTFSEPGYNSIGDPFQKRQDKDNRHGGLNFKAGGKRTGKGNDALFGKFSALYDGEKYSKDYKQVREERLQSQKGYIQTVPFKPSNPMKESSGLGGNYGTLSKIASGPSGTEERELQKGDARDVPPNIVTNPGKKGTYGMNKLTIGQGAKGSIGEYTYSSDAYDLQEKQERVARATSHAQRVTEQPWRPANPQRKGGPGVPGCTIGGEYQYIPPRYAKPEPVEKGLLPFKPTHPGKKGYNAPINKFPTQVSDNVPNASKTRSKYVPEFEDLAPFKPASSSKSAAVSSIVRMNVGRT